MVNEKKRVNGIKMDMKNDMFRVTEENGIEHIVYTDDYNKIVDILEKIDETWFKDEMIPAEFLAERLCAVRKDLVTNMLRPTGGYYSFYHLVLKILDNQRFIDYYKDGSVLKNEIFKNILKVKRGLDKHDIWVDRG
jgi:hypothetical protein